MSSDPPTTSVFEREPRRAVWQRRRRAGAHATLLAHGEPLVWLAGGALAVALAMVVGLLGFIFVQGASTFWPAPLTRVRMLNGDVYLGEETRQQSYQPDFDVFPKLSTDIANAIRNELTDTVASSSSSPSPIPHLPTPDPDPDSIQAIRQRIAQGDISIDSAVEQLTQKLIVAAKAKLDSDGLAVRRSFRTGNFEIAQTHFHWLDDFAIASQDNPAWALVLERLSKGRFYGTPVAFLIDGKSVATEPGAVWAKFQEYHDAVRDRWRQQIALERDELGAIARADDAARLAVVAAGLKYGLDSTERANALAAQANQQAQSEGKAAAITAEIKRLHDENDRYQLQLQTADGKDSTQYVAEIVRAYPANQLSTAGKWGVYFSRWKEFLLDDPRNANSEGGVFPAIWGTIAMTLIMTLMVVPFGVLAALYLREYAKVGPITSAVRISINNLAGVPSVVFGVFGLGFFCYVLGAHIDQIFFPAELAEHKPVFGTGGLLWASLTLALLTLPVVIVATEEALAAVPNSMREGSYACGASKWQTIRRIVLPRALPGIMTGAILAMARGAGEVAPLMLVGVVKIAPDLPIDRVFPFVHLQRSFLHLGFGIYDLGFQSQNSEASKPLVFTMTLLLIAIITGLNVAAIWLRNRLRRRFLSAQF